MKTLTMRWMIAAAALAVTAGGASAQTFKAEIPLSFRVGKMLMLPGSYRISVETGSASEIVYVHNLDTQSTVVLLAGVKSDAPKAWRQEGKPMIGFECVGDLCALRRLWNGQDTFAYGFRGRALPPGEDRRAAVVRLTPVKAD